MSGMRLAAVRLATLALTATMLAGCGSQASRSDAWASSSAPGAVFKTEAEASPIPTEYDEEADATADINAALDASKRDGKEVLLEFGADWCPDSRGLGLLFQQPAMTRLLTSDYHLVLVNVGELDTNLDVAARYVDLRTSGLPALAVVRNGRTVYASDKGQFAIARTMKAPQLRAFLKRWAA